MFGLLLDEQISPTVAEQMSRHRPDITVQSVHTWHDGAYAGEDDELVLQAAAKAELTLVTYDCTKIPPVLTEWVHRGVTHAGVIFVDERTIETSDFGGLIRSLTALWDAERNFDWTDRIMYLSAAR